MDDDEGKLFFKQKFQYIEAHALRSLFSESVQCYKDAVHVYHFIHCSSLCLWGAQLLIPADLVAE